MSLHTSSLWMTLTFWPKVTHLRLGSLWASRSRLHRESCALTILSALTNGGPMDLSIFARKRLSVYSIFPRFGREGGLGAFEGLFNYNFIVLKKLQARLWLNMIQFPLVAAQKFADSETIIIFQVPFLPANSIESAFSAKYRLVQIGIIFTSIILL